MQQVRLQPGFEQGQQRPRLEGAHRSTAAENQVSARGHLAMLPHAGANRRRAVAAASATSGEPRPPAAATTETRPQQVGSGGLATHERPSMGDVVMDAAPPPDRSMWP